MNFSHAHTLETPRCRLRFVSREDIPHIFAATRTPGFNDGMRWDPPACEEELEAPYEGNVSAWNEDRAYCFTIEDKGDASFIGRIVLRIKDSAASVWDLGFWTHPEKQNRGYMTEAVKALIRFGFDEVGASMITAGCAAWNRASESVMKKAGMRFIECNPLGFEKNGKQEPENRFGITRK